MTESFTLRDAEVDLSIIVCTRNRADKLPRTLATYYNIQSVKHWELIIADNNSTDATAEVIAKADNLDGRLRGVHVDRIGLGAARDAAWRHARGKIVAFTDDDCYPEPDYVDAVLSVFEEHPEAGCVGGRILLFDPTDARATIDERTTPVEVPPCRFLAAGFFQGANISFRRSILEEIDGLDQQLGAGTPFPCEDIDAIAATIWAGHPARFDPRPVVWHHHGRKIRDLPKLRASYDQGRGAYYAKYVLRSDTRLAYIAGWIWEDIKLPILDYFVSVPRELRSAARYLDKNNKSYLVVMLALPAVVITMVGVVLCMGRNTLLGLYRMVNRSGGLNRAR